MISSLEDCIPKSKRDREAVANAKALGFPALNPIIPDLLEWVQDINWPIAEDVAALLRDAGPEIVPHIRTVLQSDDDLWKCWTLSRIVGHLPYDFFQELRPDVERIAYHPTRYEIESQTHEDAQDAIERQSKRTPQQ
jgi:hypothetical protein